jgi:hypothetical protein
MDDATAIALSACFGELFGELGPHLLLAGAISEAVSGDFLEPSDFS